MSEQFKQLVRVPNAYTHNPENNKGAYQKAAVWGSSDDDPKLNSYPLYYMDAEGNEQQLTTVDQSGAGQIYYAFVQNGIFTLSKDSSIVIQPYIKTDNTDDPVSFCLYDLDNGKVGNPVNNTFVTSAQYMQGGYLEVRNAQDIEKVKQRVIPFNTLDEALNETDPLKLYDGSVINLKERTSGNGGGAFWDAVLSSSVSENGFNIVQCKGLNNISLKLRVGDVANAKQFGCVGNGVEDDTLPALAAWNYGKNAYMPEGAYRFTKSVNIPSNLSLKMAKGARLFVEDGFMTGGSGEVFIRMANVSNTTISGGTIDGGVGPIDLGVYPNQKTTTEKADYGLTSPIEMVSCSSLKDVVFDGVRFINCIYNAIKENGAFSSGTQAKRVTIKNCYFDNVLGNTIDGNFQDSIFTNNQVNLTGDIRSATRGSFIISSARNCVVSNNAIRQTTDSTIYLTGTIEQGHTTVTGNTIVYGGKDAIKFVQSGSNGTISGNHVMVAGKTSIGVFDDGVTDYGSISVVGNSCGYRVTPTDILDPDTNYTTPLTINGCNLQNPKWVGEYDSACIACAGSYCSVTGNTINNAIGLTISVSEKGAVISDNSVYSCAGPMVYSTTFGVTITGNSGFDIGGNSSLVFDNITDGIYIAGSEVSITANSLINVQGRGVMISNGSNILISANSIDNAINGGVFANHLSNSVKIDGNNITDSGENGIYINGVAGTYAKLLSVSNNTIQRSSSRGIWLRELENGLISNNTISESVSDGIRISDNSLGLTVNGNMVINNSNDGILISDTGNFTLGNNSVSGNKRGIITAPTCEKGVVVGNSSSGNNSDNYGIQGTSILPASIEDFNA